MAPVTLSRRAREAVAGRSVPPHGWYLDLGLLERYWGGDRAYHHTISSTLVYARGDFAQPLEGLCWTAALLAGWMRPLLNSIPRNSKLAVIGMAFLEVLSSAIDIPSAPRSRFAKRV